MTKNIKIAIIILIIAAVGALLFFLFAQDLELGTLLVRQKSSLEKPAEVEKPVLTQSDEEPKVETVDLKINIEPDSYDYTADFSLNNTNLANTNPKLISNVNLGEGGKSEITPINLESNTASHSKSVTPDKRGDNLTISMIPNLVLDDKYATGAVDNFLSRNYRCFRLAITKFQFR